MEERIFGRGYYDCSVYRYIPFVPKTRGLNAIDQNGDQYWIIYREGIRNISILPGQFFYKEVDFKNRYNYTRKEKIDQLEILKKYLCIMQGLGESDSLINYRYEVCEKDLTLRKHIFRGA